MNRAEIRTLARRTLNESAERYWLDADLNAWLNLGIQEINQVIRVESNGTLANTTTAGVSAITLGSSVRSVVAVMLNGVPVGRTTVTELVAAGADLTATGTPTRRYTTRDASGALVLNLWPIPDAGYAYTVWTQNELSELADDADELALPPRWHGALRSKILAEAYAKGGRDYGAATAYDAEWQKALQRLPADLINNDDEGYAVRYVDSERTQPGKFNPLE